VTVTAWPTSAVKEAPAGDAELVGQLRAKEIDGGFHGPFGVL
jgi:hypothetical protein